MDLSCLNSIINNNLAVHIDLTKNESWNLNSGFTSVSLTKWSKAVSDNIFLYDFGLTAFDNGRVKKMHDTLTIKPTDNKLTLYRVGYNTPTGGTFYDGYGITGVTSTGITSTHVVITGGTGTTVITGTTYYGAYPGNFFDLNGGYLQGFFKLKDYNYEILPPRYGSGITIETIIRITPQSFNNGYFYFMGARAEDKYVPSFSGESIQISGTTTATTNSSYYNSTGIKTINSLNFSGVTTSLGNHLNNYVNKDVMLKGSNTGNMFKNQPVQNNDLGRNGNTIGFFLSSDNRIGYTRINATGLTETNVSTNQILFTGWTIIDIVFKPYSIILDRKTLDCAASRKGEFSVYVNGRRFWKIENFDEFYFKGFKTQKEKQLGVPYNISWGGATHGLKHSYHYDLHKYDLFNENSPISIGTGFTFTTNPFWSDPTCSVPPLDESITGMSITGNNTRFTQAIDCTTGTTASTVLSVYNVTGTTISQYNILYNKTIKLLSNRDYIFTVKVYEENIFAPQSSGTIGMFFSGDTEITIVEKIVFDALYDEANKWTTIQYKIRTKDNTGLTNVKVGLYIDSDAALVSRFKVYFDNFNYRGSDVLSLDHTKDMSLIEELYDRSFIGGIQKLRIYDVAFNSQEILHNAVMESRNPAYGFLINRGGRIIYSPATSTVNSYNNNVGKQAHVVKVTSTSNANVNVITPYIVPLNTLNITDNYYTVTGNRIYFNKSGQYKLSLNVVVENGESTEKLIGINVKKNDTSFIFSDDLIIYLFNAIGYPGQVGISDFNINTMISAGDYIELIAFRSGNGGVANLVPNNVWIKISDV